jgi:hypothetical protein
MVRYTGVEPRESLVRFEHLLRLVVVSSSHYLHHCVRLVNELSRQCNLARLLPSQWRHRAGRGDYRELWYWRPAPVALRRAYLKKYLFHCTCSACGPACGSRFRHIRELTFKFIVQLSQSVLQPSASPDTTRASPTRFDCSLHRFDQDSFPHPRCTKTSAWLQLYSQCILPTSPSYSLRLARSPHTRIVRYFCKPTLHPSLFLLSSHSYSCE